MNTLSKPRIESIDLLKGLVMVIMALDHVRDFFHSGHNYYSPTDVDHTTLPIYFTRWITHYCAPTFSFLAGASAFFVGSKKGIPALSSFLWKRGLWLVFLELTVITFGWTFDIKFGVFLLIVIWSLGISMIVLAALVYLPRWAILAFSCALIFGHNLLDTVHVDGNFLWGMLHDPLPFQLFANHGVYTGYPVIPWIGVMSLGYCFGSLYITGFSSEKRKKILMVTGLSATVLFIALRFLNGYGNPMAYGGFDTFRQNLMSFLNPEKYPPSLMYLLMTLGPSLLFLSTTENVKGKIVTFFCTIGRVPFFYYVLHLYLIHVLAVVTEFSYPVITKKLIDMGWIVNTERVLEPGFGLVMTYVVWIIIIAIVYPLCKKYDAYKISHREKWWLSYV